MPYTYNIRRPPFSIKSVALALMVLGLIMVYHTSPSSPYKLSPSPSTLIRTSSSIKDQQKLGVISNSDHPASGLGKLFVDRLNRRHTTTATDGETMIEEGMQETSDLASTGGKRLTTRSQHGSRSRIQYCVPRDTEDSSTFDGKHCKRDSLKWTEHRGPPAKHSSRPSEDVSRRSRHFESEPIQQIADEDPQTSMNSGIERPKLPPGAQSPGNKADEPHHVGITPKDPRWICGPGIGNIDPEQCKTERWRRKRSKMDSQVAKSSDSKGACESDDKEALLTHSLSTSNEKLQVQRSAVPTASDSKNIEIHQGELVPRRLICDCGVYICTHYRSICKKWKEVPDKKRSVAKNSIENAPQVQRKHYIPPYWQSNESTDRSTVLKGNSESRSEKIPLQAQPDSNAKNITYNKPAHAPGVAFTDVLLPKKCNATTSATQHQCETTHQASIIFYSLLGIFLTSILLLVLLKCYMCFRKRRNVAQARKSRARLHEKSGTSSHPSSAGDSLSSKQEKTRSVGDDADRSRRYINMDGVDDDWPEFEYNKWNIFSRKRRGPGRFSPEPEALAPRIPTLKLPKPVFATVRKVSGLGFEGMLASYKRGFKGNTTDISRVKWTSTV